MELASTNRLRPSSSAGAADLEGYALRGVGRGRGTELPRNGSSFIHPSSSAAEVEGSTPMSGTAANSNDLDATSDNVSSLTRISVCRGLLRPSHTASTSITTHFKRSMHPKAFAWKLVPEEKKLEYFEEFRKEFTWEPQLENAIHKAWRVKAAIRYKDMVHDFKELWDKKLKPPFISDEEWEHWNNYWKREDVKERSRQAKLNRMSEPEGPGTGHVIHRGGSRCAQEYALQLAEDLNLPEDKIDWHVFLRYHYKDGEYTDAKAKKIADEVYRLAEEERRPLPGTTEERDVDMNELYLRVVKALEKKNRLFGQGCRYTTASQSHGSAAEVSSFTSAAMEEQLTSLQTQLSTEREERLQSQTKQTELEEKLKKQAEEHEKMKAQLEHIMRHWSGPPP